MKEQPKKEKPKHEIELEQRPMPQEGEAHPDWLKRIGGPNAKLMESFKEYQAPKDKAKEPLLINKDANFILNDKNLGAYFDKEKIDAEIDKKNPNVRFNQAKGQYRLNKELFKQPERYFHVIGEELKNKRKIVADKNFGKGVEKWKEELKGEKTPEKTMGEKGERGKIFEKLSKDPFGKEILASILRLNAEWLRKRKGENALPEGILTGEIGREWDNRIRRFQKFLEQEQPSLEKSEVLRKKMDEITGGIEVGIIDPQIGGEQMKELLEQFMSSEKGKEEKPNEKPEREKPAATRKEKQAGPPKSEGFGGKEKKEPTLDEQIAVKQKEIEEIERGYNIYYSPVVQDLLGLYYKDRLKDIKGLKKELKGMEKEKGKKPKGMPEEPEQLLTAKEYLGHIRGTDKLFTEMALIRGKVKRKELKPAEYKKAKAKWQGAYDETLEMNEMLSPKELEKIIKIRKKEGKKKDGLLALLIKKLKKFKK